MTTSKPYHDPDGIVAFEALTIGPRSYIAVSPIGWAETYDRKQADEAAKRFIEPIELKAAIDLFLLKLTLAPGAKKITWGMVIGFLEETTNREVISEAAGVGFWGLVLLAQHQEGAN
jgi:hypothetical protein